METVPVAGNSCLALFLSRSQPRNESRFDRFAEVLATEINVPDCPRERRILDRHVRLADDFTSESLAWNRGQHHMVALANVDGVEDFGYGAEFSAEGVGGIVQTDSGLDCLGHVAPGHI